MKFPNYSAALKTWRDPLAHPSDQAVASAIMHLTHAINCRNFNKSGDYWRERAHMIATHLREIAADRESDIEAHLQNKWENGT